MDESLQRLQDVLAKNEKISIAVGKNPTLDEMAAALSFYLTLASLGKQVSIACPTDPLVEVSSLVGIDKVRKSLDGEGGDLIVSFPYREGEIEKVSYTLEDGFLNIIVKAGEQGLSFTEKDVQYKRAGGVPSLLCIIGTPRLSDLGSLFNPQALKDTTVVNIDNKQDNQGFGDVVLVSPRYSSVSEQMANILQSLGYDFDVDIAQNLLSGIAFATDNFQKPTTSFLAFEMAAQLMRKGAQRQRPQRQAPAPQMDEAFYQPYGQQQPRGFGPQTSAPSSDFQSRPQRPMHRPAPFPKQPQQRPQPQQHSRPSFPQTPAEKDASLGKDKQTQEAPPDWLAPKVYKGSTNI